MQSKTFSIRQALRFGWKAVRKDLGIYAGATLVFFVVSFMLGLLSSDRFGVVRIVIILFQLVFVYNLYRVGLKAYKNQPIAFSDFYTDGTLVGYLNFIGAQILKMLFALPIIGVGLVLILFVAHADPLLIPFFAALLALALLIYASVIALVNPSSAAGMSPFDSISESFMLTRHVRIKIILFFIVAMAIAIVSAIPFGLGLLVTIPLLVLASVHIYETMKGVPQTLSQHVPVEALKEETK